MHQEPALHVVEKGQKGFSAPLEPWMRTFSSSLTSRVPQLTRLDMGDGTKSDRTKSRNVTCHWLCHFLIRLAFESCKAAIFLEMAGGNVETAVEIYMSSQGGEHFKT